MHRSNNSYSNLVGAGEQRWRYREAKRLGRLEIDDEIELGRLLHSVSAGFAPRRIKLACQI